MFSYIHATILVLVYLSLFQYASSSDNTSYPWAEIGFRQNPDGSFTRLPNSTLPTTPPSSDPSNPVLTKDVPINPSKPTWARIYLPRPDTNNTRKTKLPLIVYFHAAGFVKGSAATTLFQKFCSDIVEQTPAVMVSVEYRLAPEHRLPAAYEDGLEALYWIKTSQDPWLTKYADLSRSFIMGSSSGGNMVYNVGVLAVTRVHQLMPLKIQGLILHIPYFGGVERTPSEIRLANNSVDPLIWLDMFTELAKPIGTNRDIAYFNPMKNPNVKILRKMKKEGWRFLVTGVSGDPLIDAEMAFAKMLKENGLDVMEMFREGGYHGIELYDPVWANIFYGVVKNFILA